MTRLGGTPDQIAAFRDYVAAFSEADFDRFTAYYTDDVTLILNDTMPPIIGPDAIAAFYRPIFARLRERLAVQAIRADNERIELDATMRFTALADAPDFMLGPLQAGEFLEAPVTVTYQLRDGLIAHISVARHSAFVRGWLAGSPSS